MAKETTIDKVKKGDLFQLPGTTVVYVKDDYNRHTKRYMFHRFDDCSAFREKRKGTIVIADIYF